MENLQIIQSKIYEWKDLKNQIAVWKFKDNKIVFTNGCFDILHLGHIDYLSKAADQGDVLIVGLNTDTSVRKIKGPDRPVNDQKARALALASLHFVDAIIFFDEDTPYELVKMVQPDVIMKGNDYKPDEVVGADIVKENRGEVITVELVPGYSTTDLIEKLKKL